MATWQDNLAAFNSSLLFAYDFEQTTGAVIDSSPAGNNASVVSATRGVLGKIGNAFEYNGSTDRLDATTVSVTSAGYTISAWINLDNVTGQKIIYSNWETSSYFSDGMLSFRIDGQKLRMRWQTAAGIGSATDVQTGDVLSASTWHHVVCQINAANTYLYVDGTKRTFSNTVTWTANTFNTSPQIAAGDDSTGGQEFFLDGKIDLLYSWDTVLTDAAISDLYNAGAGLIFPPKRIAGNDTSTV